MIKTLLKISISLILLIFLIWISEISSVWQQIKSVQWPTILGCMAALFFAQTLSSLRWQWILKSEGADIPLKTLFVSYMRGMFVNNFLPTTIGGDAIKTYDIYRITHNPSISIVSVFLERFTGLIALIFLSWIGVLYLLSHSTNIILVAWGFINVACLLTIVCVFYEPTSQWILGRLPIKKSGTVANAIRLSFKRLNAYKNKKALLIKLLLISIPIQLMTIFIYQVISVAMGIGFLFMFFLYSVPLIILISLLPVSFGGLGVREGITVFVYTLAGASVETALSVSLIYLSIIYFFSLIGGVFLVSCSVKNYKNTHKIQDHIEMDI